MTYLIIVLYQNLLSTLYLLTWFFTSFIVTLCHLGLINLRTFSCLRLIPVSVLNLCRPRPPIRLRSSYHLLVVRANYASFLPLLLRYFLRLYPQRKRTIYSNSNVPSVYYWKETSLHDYGSWLTQLRWCGFILHLDLPDQQCVNWNDWQWLWLMLLRKALSGLCLCYWLLCLHGKTAFL
jgi:hypothetical protein